MRSPSDPFARRRSRGAFRPDPAAEVDAELDFHLAMRAAEQEAAGVDPALARDRALARFGNLAATRNECIDIYRRREKRMERSATLRELAQDLGYGWRGLRRRPGFAAVAVLTLALGIGANSAIFTVVDATLLRPLPYPEAERLVRIYHENPSGGQQRSGFLSPPDFTDLEQSVAGLEPVTAYYHEPGQSGVNLRLREEPLRLEAAFVDEAFFPTFGVAAIAGRTFSEEENVEGQDRVLVLSAALWQSELGGDPAAVGSTVRLDGEPFTVVGVMPPGFAFPSPDVEVWVPLSLVGEDDIPTFRSLRWMRAAGRLSSGVALEQAEAEVDTLFAGLAAAHPESNEGWTEGRVEPLQEALVGEVRPALVLLALAVALVLLVACVNLASLLLARGSGRLRELAIRHALGAGRARLVRQLLTESLTLGLLGGAAGLLLAWAGLAALRAWALPQLPRGESVTLDGRVVAFTLGVSLLATLLFGLLPALRVARPVSAEALRPGKRTVGDLRSPLRGGLVVAETGLAVLLLVGAGLLLRSLGELYTVDPGFRAEGVLTASVTISDERSRDEHRRHQETLLRRLAAIPGVVAVGGSKTLPLHGGSEPMGFSLPGAPGDQIHPAGGAFIVTPGYFAALGIPVVAGREYRFSDAPEDPPVIVVNRALARQLWPGQPAVGQTVLFGGAQTTVAGVVGDVRAAGLTQPPEPAIYVGSHLAQRSTLKLFLRTEGEPAAFAHAVRAAVREVDPTLPVSGLAPLSEVVAETVVQPRFFATLLGAFSALALVLALVGLYGLLSFTVARRGSEIGVRLALGATRRKVVSFVLGRTVRLAGAGLVLGILGALAVGRVLAGQLYGVEPTDLPTLVAVVATVAVGALGASWLPARRAAAVDPVESLRQE